MRKRAPTGVRAQVDLVGFLRREQHDSEQDYRPEIVCRRICALTWRSSRTRAELKTHPPLFTTSTPFVLYKLECK